jgi:hypothetical protein
MAFLLNWENIWQQADLSLQQGRVRLRSILKMDKMLLFAIQMRTLSLKKFAL